MQHRLNVFDDVGLDEAMLQLAIREHETHAMPRLRTLWSYYRNAPEPAGIDGGRRTRLAQEAGLPTRLTAANNPGEDDRARRREIVIENDIAWRVHAMVDFMFGKPVRIVSTARDAAMRAAIERTLDSVWESSGGIGLLQDMALLGHIYGHIDLLLRMDEDAMARRPASAGADAGESHRLPTARTAPASRDGRPGTPATADAALAAASLLRIEIVEPMRGIALLSPSDYRRTEAYIINFERQLNDVETRRPARGPAMWWQRRDGAGEAGARSMSRRRAAHTEIFSARWRQVYDDGRLIEEHENRWLAGELPFVHIQNTSQPFRYNGLSEVEPLIPLQNELNTRLSDRASRVTMQSFRMYLARGLELSGPLTIGPGQVILTDSPDASIQAFGGDTDAPGEAAHILEIREAMDKTSGIPPLASGVVRAKIGNLTSANALRITLMGVLSKTARKRITYGRGMAQMCRLILTALDTAGILRTEPADRGVRLDWPDPLPEDTRERIAAARAKHDLGVPARDVLAELGHTSNDDGIV
jgi:hypothetical protein